MAAPVNSARRRHRYIDVPYQISTVVDEGLAMRLREPHLDGDLIAKEGTAVLMRNIVCNQFAALLTFLYLSGNLKLSAAGVKHLADRFANTTAHWRSCA
jgi:hypothetical protein